MSVAVVACFEDPVHQDLFNQIKKMQLSEEYFRLKYVNFFSSDLPYYPKMVMRLTDVILKCLCNQIVIFINCWER